MPAGGKKGNKGGTGNPGYGALKLIRDNVKKYCPQWWKEWEVMMNQDKVEQKKFAMVEFNKLQAKLMPTIVGSDEDNPLTVKFDVPFRVDKKEKKDK